VKKTLVLGIGNVLLSDDGAGVHLARRLARDLADCGDVEVVDGGTLSFTLAPLIGAARRLIILDATELGQSAGDVKTFTGSELDALFGRARLTVHEVNLRDVLDIARITDSLPGERALVGIQPASLGWGMEPTPAVAAALDRAAVRVMELLAAESWSAVSSFQPDLSPEVRHAGA
jgi:hydrogenase maturation protease